jgi:hypothetical protein
MKKENHPEIRKAIRKIISEYNRYLIEGIDIDNESKTVSFNSGHENNIDTSILLNPTYDEINGIPIISIFKRKDNLDKTDGNPLIYALKNKRGWKFQNPQQDILNLLKQFIRISEKIKPEYEAIITVPSGNPLNTHFLHRLNKIIKAKVKVTDYLSKLNADDVWEDYVDWGRLKRDFSAEYEKTKAELLRYFKKMESENDNMFSFRYISNVKLRKYITKTMWVENPEEQIKYAPFINDKNILILDDTISSGASISEMCKEIISSFTPKSITVITLFSRV